MFGSDEHAVVCLLSATKSPVSSMQAQLNAQSQGQAQEAVTTARSLNAVKTLITAGFGCMTYLRCASNNWLVLWAHLLSHGPYIEDFFPMRTSKMLVLLPLELQCMVIKSPAAKHKQVVSASRVLRVFVMQVSLP